MSEILYIVIPAYNEEENIRRCVEDWYPIVRAHDGEGRSRLVVIDDGSTDSTLSSLKEMQQSLPLLEPLTKPNGGHGSALLYGYRYAVDHGADLIFQTDSDGQTNPAEFAAFWEKRGEYDAVIGNRIERGDGKGRKFVENVVCLLLRLIFGVKAQDANAPFRLMRAVLVGKYLKKMPVDFNLPNIMLTAYCLYFKEKTLFLPITFKAREKGVNSVNYKKIVRIGKKAVLDFIGLRMHIND